ncbi:hypothetical protein SMICM304S_07255 [Streptomyces microflavus]
MRPQDQAEQIEADVERGEDLALRHDASEVRGDEPGDVAQTACSRDVQRSSRRQSLRPAPGAAGDPRFSTPDGPRLVGVVHGIQRRSATQVDGERGVVVGREGRVAAVQALKGGIRHRGGAQ